MELIFSARAMDSPDYVSLQEHGLEVSVEALAESTAEMQVTFRNLTKTPWEGVLHIELPFEKKAPRFFMPAFMYGRNRGEEPMAALNEFPRIREGEMQRPASPWWMVRGDRLSHPVVLIYDSGWVYGISASPYFILRHGRKQPWFPGVDGEFYQYAGYSCSIEKGTIGYTLGYENAPWLFIQSHQVVPRTGLEHQCFHLEPGETVQFSLWLYQYAAASETGIYEGLRDVYHRYHQKPRDGQDTRETVEALASAIHQYAWLKEDKNYATFVYDKKENGEYLKNKLLCISWTSGLAVAVPMLMAGLRLKNDAFCQNALACINHIVDHSLNKSSGLPYDAYNEGQWSVNGWWFDRIHNKGHSAYLVGQALFCLLKAYDYEKRLAGRSHDQWISFVHSILTHIEQSKNQDMEYPYIFSEKTGAGFEYDSFAGTWCLAAAAYYSFLSGSSEFLDGLKKSEAHYYSQYVAHAECYGTPLDTDKATDSEGALAYIRAVRYLHQLTGDGMYLEHMRDALYYEFTFKFCYNSPVKAPPLGKIGWSSCGGSVTSVANPHIHPMSSSIAGELLYYIEETHDAYAEERLRDTVLWGCQTYNTFDNEYGFGKKGWMSERFCYSEGLLSEKYADGTLASTWLCLMPWAGSCIIEGLTGELWDRKI